LQEFFGIGVSLKVYCKLEYCVAKTPLGHKKPLLVLLFFFASPKKNQKKSPTKDYIPFVGWFPD
jgi:hypothetical protein